MIKIKNYIYRKMKAYWISCLRSLSPISVKELKVHKKYQRIRKWVMSHRHWEVKDEIG